VEPDKRQIYALIIVYSAKFVTYTGASASLLVLKFSSEEESCEKMFIAQIFYALTWLADLITICLSCYLSLQFSRDVQDALHQFLLVFKTKEKVASAVDYFAAEIAVRKRERFLEEYTND